MRGDKLRFAVLDHTDARLAQSITSLFHAAYTIEASLIGVTSFPPLRRTAEDVASALSTFYGCFDGDQLLAVAEVEITAGNPVEVASFAVNPVAFRRGVGSALLTHLLREAGDTPVIVATALANTPGIRLYEKHGFRACRQWSTPDNIRMLSLVYHANNGG